MGFDDIGQYPQKRQQPQQQQPGLVPQQPQQMEQQKPDYSQYFGTGDQFGRAGPNMSEKVMLELLTLKNLPKTEKGFEEDTFQLYLSELEAAAKIPGIDIQTFSNLYRDMLDNIALGQSEGTQRWLAGRMRGHLYKMRLLASRSDVAGHPIGLSNVGAMITSRSQGETTQCLTMPQEQPRKKIFGII